jgi:hypothetical protein
MKTYFMIATLCSPFFECMVYEQNPETQKKFYTLKGCEKEIKRTADGLEIKLKKLNIPYVLKVECIKENKNNKKEKTTV